MSPSRVHPPRPSDFFAFHERSAQHNLLHLQAGVLRNSPPPFHSGSTCALSIFPRNFFDNLDPSARLPYALLGRMQQTREAWTRQLTQTQRVRGQPTTTRKTENQSHSTTQAQQERVRGNDVVTSVGAVPFMPRHRRNRRRGATVQECCAPTPSQVAEEDEVDERT